MLDGRPNSRNVGQARILLRCIRSGLSVFKVFQATPNSLFNNALLVNVGDNYINKGINPVSTVCYRPYRYYIKRCMVTLKCVDYPCCALVLGLRSLLCSVLSVYPDTINNLFSSTVSGVSDCYHSSLAV